MYSGRKTQATDYSLQPFTGNDAQYWYCIHNYSNTQTAFTWKGSLELCHFYKKQHFSYRPSSDINTNKTIQRTWRGYYSVSCNSQSKNSDREVPCIQFHFQNIQMQHQNNLYASFSSCQIYKGTNGAVKFSAFFSDDFVFLLACQSCALEYICTIYINKQKLVFSACVIGYFCSTCWPICMTSNIPAVANTMLVSHSNY